jgi:hypothetical protein
VMSCELQRVRAPLMRVLRKKLLKVLTIAVNRFAPAIGCTVLFYAPKESDSPSQAELLLRGQTFPCPVDRHLLSSFPFERRSLRLTLISVSVGTSRGVRVSSLVPLR